MKLKAEPEKISEAVEFLQKRLKKQSTKIAIVLGSGLGYFAEQLEIIDRIDQQEIPQAYRLQRDPRDRRVHGGRLHQGRVEDDDGDQEDS